MRPQLGILVGKPPQGPDAQGHWPGQDGYLAALCLGASQRGWLACLFLPQYPDHEQTIEGYTYEPARGWVKGRFFLPQVIYNRIQGRVTERAPEIELYRKHPNFFNTGFLDKWQVYQALEGKELPFSVPHTERYSDREQLRRLLDRFGSLYLKPSGGLKGLGIERITQPKLSARQHDRFLKLNYLVQQAIPLASIGNRRFDLRLLTGKGAGGQWRLITCVARVGLPGAIVTNQAAGANLVRPSQALQAAGVPLPAGSLYRWLNQQAVAAAEATEAGTGWHLAELGIDLGLDRAGNPWLIEVNARPAKSQAVIQPTDSQIKHHLFDYVAHLLKGGNKREASDRVSGVTH